MAAAVAALPLVLACGSGPDAGAAPGKAQTFQFRNFCTVSVDARPESVTFEEFNVADGNAFRPPYSVLEVGGPEGVLVVTDRGVGNGALSFDGVEREGQSFRITGGGEVEIVE